MAAEDWCWSCGQYAPLDPSTKMCRSCEDEWAPGKTVIAAIVG
jgi:hypothetical protein